MMNRARIMISIIIGSLLPSAAFAQFYPFATGGITRAEFVQMVMQQRGIIGGGTHCFRDVTTQFYADALCSAKAAGIVTGKPDNSFMPDMPITFIEAGTVALRAEGVHSAPGATWYSGYLTQLSQWDAIPDSVTNILQPISYAQAQELIQEVQDRGEDDDDDDDDNDNDDDEDEDDDMKLSVTVSDSTPEPGDRVTFRIRIENEDNDDLDDIQVVAELDNDMEYVSSTDGGNLEDDEVEWDDIEVEEDETKTILLNVEIDEDADDDDTLRLRVEAENGETLTVSRTIRVQEDDDDDGDLNLTITESDDPVEPGDQVTYRIRIENEDNDDIRVDVRAFLDDEMDFISASHSGDESRDEVEWDDIRLDEDDEITLTLTVRIKSGADDGDELELRVEANEEEDTEETEVEDDDDDNDNDDIDVSITENDDPAEEGDTITYRITLENNDNDDAEIDVRAFLDPDTSFVSASHNGDLEGDDEVVWEDFEIDEDQERIITLTVRVKTTADDGDTLRLRVEAGDGEDTETTRVED